MWVLPLALDERLRSAGVVARWSVGRVTSRDCSGNFVSLGMLGTRSDDGHSVWLWNEQLSRAPWCFWKEGCCGRCWHWPVGCLLSELFLGFVVVGFWFFFFFSDDKAELGGCRSIPVSWFVFLSRMDSDPWPSESWVAGAGEGLEGGDHGWALQEGVVKLV